MEKTIKEDQRLTQGQPSGRINWQQNQKIVHRPEFRLPIIAPIMKS